MNKSSCCNTSCSSNSNSVDKLLDSSCRLENNIDDTDILIDYEEIKTSRRVTSIRFNIKENPNYGKTHFEKAQSEKATILAKELRSTVAILEQLLEYGFNKQAAKRLVKNHEEANIINAIKAVEIYRSKHDVKNARALVETAIKEKWHPEKYVAKKK